MPLKGTGYQRGDDDWRCPAPCRRWHRHKTSQCPHCKHIPRYRFTEKARRELRECSSFERNRRKELGPED